MFRKLLLTLTALLILPALLQAQTGKVRGKVTDKETGEPLIGANVVVVGTSLGAATNIDGDYVINPVTVGTVDVTVTYIGYQSMTISGVRVNANLSTQVNFAISKGAVTLGVVEVVAERPLINKNATNSVRITDAEALVKMPARGV
ncbi:MAG: carboxypeptidase-like regulatory domain-containing protein, partial [Ignavibacteriales bacterium]|nr:carboxypeptidase-like regulatory domain-containing protein [Ignavibacteriales bacterium]